MRGLFIGAALAAACLLASGARAAETTGSVASGAGAIGASTRLPVPRFVSLKLERVNARMGPTREHEVIWIYQRAGLPVEVTAEFENWRRIRDHEGTETWVFHSMLSGKRTGMVQPRARSGELVPLMDRAGGARVVARLEPRVQGIVRSCNRTWCRFTGDGFDGWIEQERLWGVYPNEAME
jgi:SH3-like domain-containing protein